MYINMLDVTERTDHWRIIRLDEASYVEVYREKFATFNDLPKKIQEVVAVLKMCQPQERIAGVGRRIGEHTFWVEEQGVYVKGVVDGFDEGRVSKEESKGVA